MRKLLDSCATLVACNAGPEGDSPSGGRLSLRGPVYCLAILLSTVLIHIPTAYADTKYTYKDFTSKILNNPVQMRCIEKLWDLESRWDPKANNPKSSAYGIPQLLKLKETNPYRQIILGIKYIEHRYKTPCQALKYHNRKGHY